MTYPVKPAVAAAITLMFTSAAKGTLNRGIKGTHTNYSTFHTI